jgi:hypothetical protein
MDDHDVEQKLLEAGDKWRRNVRPLASPYEDFRNRTGKRPRRISVSDVAAAGLVGIVGVVVAGVLLQQAVGLPPAASPSLVATASSPSPAATVVPSVRSTIPASPTFASPTSATIASTGPEATPTLPGISPNWVRITTTGGVSPHWSPDGSYLLLEEQDVTALVLVAADGRQIGSYDGYIEPTWLTDDTFVAYNASSMPSGPQKQVTAQAMLGNATDGTSSVIDFPCCDPVGNGHGSAAVSWSLPYLHGVPQPQFSVWSDGVVTDPQAGLPIAWSPNGDKLVVAHPVTQQTITDGWMEVVRWPGLESIFEGDRSSETGLKTPFDRTGNYVAHAGVIGSGDNAVGSVDVSNLDTGVVTQIPTLGNHMSFAWDANGYVLVSDFNGLTAYTPDGASVVNTPFSGTIVSGAADGSTVLLLDSGGVLTNYLTGATVPLPATPESETGFWLSPSGSGLFVVSNGGPWLAQLP